MIEWDIGLALIFCLTGMFILAMVISATGVWWMPLAERRRPTVEEEYAAEVRDVAAELRRLSRRIERLAPADRPAEQEEAVAANA